MSIQNLIRKILGLKDPEQAQMEYLIKNGLRIGKDTAINPGFEIDGAWPWLISIGDRVTISTNVTILAHDASSNLVQCGTKLGRVDIGNDVFIGTRTTILCNTRIGDHVVIGAGSLVTHDLPGNAVYAGVPAVRICSIEEYREKNLKAMQNRPALDTIRPWYDWKNATEEEKDKMRELLEDGIGYI